MQAPYRGRLAPSPTGYLHLGHARTFWAAQQRALSQGGVLALRNEDLDRVRCRPEFVSAMFEDLHWFGLSWQEGPDCGGPYGPYSQSQRGELYRAAFERLRAGGFIYPCFCSRRDVLQSAQAPHAGDDEPIYPGTCRPRPNDEWQVAGDAGASSLVTRHSSPSWRFLVPDGEAISFVDGFCGPQQFVAGKDFGDFVVWRPDGVPSYQLAVVSDDTAMKITEVVRGQDLLRSTARQILLYRALGLPPPDFYHCPLVTDSSGSRLAKRHDALSLRELRRQGARPEALLRSLSDIS
jgi:glutamyl/glutaminyl-tRNA synthetase